MSLIPRRATGSPSGKSLLCVLFERFLAPRLSVRGRPSVSADGDRGDLAAALLTPAPANAAS